MTNLETLRSISLSFPETSEQPHFEKTSFRVGKKIFASYDAKKNQACVKLSPTDQDLFSVFDPSVVFPVPNKWGQQGWTFVNMDRIPEETLKDILTTAYCEVAPKKWALQVRG